MCIPLSIESTNTLILNENLLLNKIQHNWKRIMKNCSNSKFKMSAENPGKTMNAMVRDSQHFKRVMLSIQTLNSRKSFTDVCFVCARGYKVHAHKLLLSTVSPFMKNIFLEVQDNHQIITIHLPDVESRMMELILDFVYEGSVTLVNQKEYKDFQEVVDTLQIIISAPPTSNQSGENSSVQQTVQPIIQPQQQQLQSPQLVYMPTAPNSQGQVQYVLASPGQLNHAQVFQAPLMTQQPTGQVQNGAQVMSPQVQHGNMIQMVQQNNNQVVPMNNQMVAGGQIVQCSSQMVVQGNQQSIMSNNQMQVGMQNQMAAQSNYMTNQTVQPQPHYVMANTNQLTTNTNPSQYHQPRAEGINRSRPALPSTQAHQPTRGNSVRTRRLTRTSLPMTQNRPTNVNNRIVQRSRNVVQ